MNEVVWVWLEDFWAWLSGAIGILVISLLFSLFVFNFFLRAISAAPAWLLGAISAAIGAGTVAIIEYFSQKSLHNKLLDRQEKFQKRMELMRWQEQVVEEVYNPLLENIESVQNPDLRNKEESIPVFFITLHKLYYILNSPKIQSYRHLIYENENLRSSMESTKAKITDIGGDFLKEKGDEPPDMIKYNFDKYRQVYKLATLMSKSDMGKNLEELGDNFKKLTELIHQEIEKLVR